MTAPKIAGYAEVRIGKALRFIQITSESTTCVVGWRVNRDGSRWEVGNRTNLIMCQPDEVVRRMVLNTFYAELEGTE